VADLSHGAFIQKAYDDTYALLIAMRDYVSGQSSKDADGLEAPDRMRLSLELSRVTRQITEVMAWLMVQKAIAAGEITADEGAQQPAGQLNLPDEDSDDDRDELARLPLPARSLIDRARRIAALVRQLQNGMPASSVIKLH
jgi:regulator of CtrA degradation